MPVRLDIKRVTVVGTGVIGTGWTACFLARGLNVTATDPAANADRELRAALERLWPRLAELGAPASIPMDRLEFTPDLDLAVRETDFVQENGPERAPLKQELFARLDRALPPDVILASSSSGLRMSVIQSGCRHPERCVIGHPFNPPHLIPLVEVVGGNDTSVEVLDAAMAFYESVGKHPIRLRKEIDGHVANRLQAALWREASYLVAQGVASVSDVDDAVRWGLGPRWSAMGPNLVFHLAGGRGGIRHFMDHLAPSFGAWWEDLGRPALNPELMATIVAGVETEAGDRTIGQLEEERDRALVKFLR